MKSKFIFLIFSMVLLSGFIFSATPADPPVSNTVFSVDIVLPNPYYGLIVADASNLANPDSVSSNSIQNNAVVLSKIGASNPGANKFLKINSTGNSLEWATVEGGSGSGDGVVYTATNPISISNNVIGLSDLGITSSKLADNSVNTSKIANFSINGMKIASEAVDEDQIRNEAVTSQKLDTYAVTSNKINTAAVTKEKIAVKSVDHARLEIYPIDKCPAENASIIYRNGRLEWSNYISCGSSVSVGAINSSVTKNYFAAPFNSCVKSVTHTVSPVTCTGENCIEEWSLFRSGGSDSVTNNLSNVTNTSRTVTFNASDNDLYNTSYDLQYKLSQPATGLTQTVSRSGFSAISNEENTCAPIVPSSLNVLRFPSDGCINYFEVKALVSCVGSCNYVMYVDNLPHSEGSFTGTQTITENVYVSDIIHNNPKVKFKITNTGPAGLVGLERITPEGTLQITLPQMVDGLLCSQN
jgi:hypothetical protein